MKALITLLIALASVSAQAGLFLSESEEPTPEEIEGLFLSE